MHDSLDLNSLAERIRKERRATARNWWVFGVFVAALTVITGLLYVAMITSTDACQVNLFCHLFSLSFDLYPILVAVSLALVMLHNYQQRRASAKPYLDELAKLELPPPINPWKAPGIIVLVIVIGLIVFGVVISSYNIGIFLLAFFISTIPFFSFNWVPAPLSSARYDEVIRRANIYDKWFPGGSLNIRGITEIFAGRSIESEQVHRTLLARLIKAKSSEALGLNNLAYELVLQKRYEEALALLESAIRINPHLADSYDSLAIWYLFQNLDSQRALELAEFHSKLPPTPLGLYKNASTAIKLATRAWAEARTGQHERAETTIKDALKKASPKNIPYYASTLFTLGKAKTDLEDISGAREYFGQAAEIDPRGRFGKMAADALKQIDDNSLA
jgi:tetratricopeptide (TPR) repeat protein